MLVCFCSFWSTAYFRPLLLIFVQPNHSDPNRRNPPTISNLILACFCSFWSAPPRFCLLLFIFVQQNQCDSKRRQSPTTKKPHCGLLLFIFVSSCSFLPAPVHFRSTKPVAIHPTTNSPFVFGLFPQAK